MKMNKFSDRLLLILGSVTIILCGCGNHQAVVDEPIKTGETEEIGENSYISDGQQTESESTSQPELFEFPNEIHHEEELINSLELMNQKIDDIKDTVKENETLRKAVSSFKKASIKLGNFIIGKDTIGGYTFSELTDSGKEKVIALSQDIDNKLLTSFPWYEGMKESLVEKYHAISNFIKDTTIELIGEENYQYFGELKDKTKQKVKNGHQYLKDKFENFLEKHSE